MDEINAFRNSINWVTRNLDPVGPPRKQNVIKTKCVFDLKRNHDGKFIRCKARLDSNGFSKIPGIDFLEVFSPLPRYATVRFMMSLSGKCGWKRWEIDLKCDC